MKEEGHRLILDGNAFYEIDLECMIEKKRQEKEEKQDSVDTVIKRQRK